MAGTTDITVLRCLDCGKCTSVCPVARAGNTYSPRRVIRGLVEGRTDGMGDAIWSCLTCMYCDTRCPQEVPVSGAMPPLRHQSRLAGEKPPFTRCSAMDAVAAIQSQAELAQDRMDWIPSDVKIDPESKTLFFVGCLPYFDAFFTENEVNTLESAVATIRILNALGIEPAVLPDERCCGHDQLWSGEEEVFERLAKMNVAMFKRIQPELVVTVCPECSMTLEREYRRRFGVPDCEIKHISQLVAENADHLHLSPRAVKATFRSRGPMIIKVWTGPSRRLPRLVRRRHSPTGSGGRVHAAPRRGPAPRQAGEPARRQ